MIASFVTSVPAFSTATQKVVDEHEMETMPDVPVTPVGTVWLFHSEPPSVVPAIAGGPKNDSDPVTSHTEVEAQEMPLGYMTPGTSDGGDHVAPPSSVFELNAPVRPRPTMSHVDVDGHEMASSCPKAVGVAWVDQTVPPSVVPRRIDVLPSPPCIASHVDAEAHDRLVNLVMPEGTVWIVHVVPPFSVWTISACVPTCAAMSQTETVGQEISPSPLTSDGTASLNHVRPPSVVPKMKVGFVATGA
jgi:hypothetical protein